MRTVLIALLLCISVLFNPLTAWSATNWCDEATAETCWNIETGSGESLVDQSSNSRDGTFKGSGEPAWSTDVPAAGDGFNGTSTKSLDFDGADDYITTTYDGVLGTAARTVVFWSKCNDNGTQVVIAWGVGGAGETYSISIEGGIAWVRVSSGASSWKEADFTDGTWKHFAFSLEASKTVGDIELFVDGSLEGMTDVGTRAINTANNLDVLIGEDLSGGNYYTDLLDELAIFSTDLSSTDVNDIMDNGLVQAAAGGPLVGAVMSTIIF